MHFSEIPKLPRIHRPTHFLNTHYLAAVCTSDARNGLNRCQLAKSFILGKLRLFAHYNYCSNHGTPKMAPAMIHGLTTKIWSVRELVKEVLRST